MKTSESTRTILPLLLKVQKEVGKLTKEASNPFFKSKYADLGSVMEVLKEPLNSVGIVVLQPTYAENGSNYLETMLLHAESGEFVSASLKLELSKVDMQNLGSAITYARRYTLQSLGFLFAEDDDAEATMGRPKETKTAKTTPAASTTATMISSETRPTFRRTPQPTGDL